MRYVLAALPLLAVFALPAAAGQKGDARCALYGEGFVYSESTGTCVKVSGEIRGGYHSGHKVNGFDTEGQLTIDARKETELGQLRIVVPPKYSQGAACDATKGMC